MVVLQGELGQSLKVFSGFQTHPLHSKLRARLFRQLASHGICTRIFFDNAFDGGLQGDGNALIELTRQAFERRRQLIIVTRAEVNGPRAIAPQQDGKRAEDFLWSKHLARQHLNRTVTTKFKKQARRHARSLRVYSAPSLRMPLRTHSALFLCVSLCAHSALFLCMPLCAHSALFLCMPLRTHSALFLCMPLCIRYAFAMHSSYACPYALTRHSSYACPYALTQHSSYACSDPLNIVA